MLVLKDYPIALQLLMQTDGTVTELIKLLANEEITVIKLLEHIDNDSKNKVLHRHIYLQGNSSAKNWVFAQSEVYLDKLPNDFVHDLINKTIPIGTLWSDYQMETFKKVIYQKAKIATDIESSGFKEGTKILTRQYQVINNKSIIMLITESFPISDYKNLI